MNDPVILKAGANRMEVHPRFGGAVGELCLSPACGAGAVPVFVPDAAEELEHNPWFRGRILFPFCDRIRKGEYRFEGRLYRLPRNEEGASAIHGLIYDRPGTIISREESGAASEVTLEWVLGEDPGYPFKTALRLTYRVLRGDRGTAELIFTAENRGTGPAPAGFGWHPYIRLPGAGADDMMLQIPADTWVETDKDLFPTGRVRPVTDEGGYYDFRSGKNPAGGSYDIAFPLAGKAAAAVVSSREYSLTVQTEGAFDYFQFFIPPGRESAALEPFTCATEAFNRTDMGMRVLGSGESMWGRVRLHLQRA